VTSAPSRNLTLLFFSGLFIASLTAAMWFESWYLLALPFAALTFYAGWQHINFIFFLLMFSLPFSMEWKLSGGLGTDFPDEILMLLTSALFFLYWLFKPSVLPVRMLKHPLIFILLLTFAWSALTAIFSTHPLFSFKFLLAKTWYFGAFILAPLIAFRNERIIKTSFAVLVIAMFAVVMITMARHFQYRFSFAGINPSLLPFFRNHVSYSAMLVCLIPLFYFVTIKTRSLLFKNVVRIAVLIMLVALFFSYARGAWLALVTGAMGYLLIKRRMMVATFIVAFISLVATLFWLKSDDHYLEYAHDYRTTIYHEDFREHLQATYEFKDASTAERFYRWIAGVRMIRGNELTGFGPSTFYHNYKPYAVPAFKTWVSDNPERSTVHNYFLLITIEQGIPGLAFFLALIVAMLWYSQRIYGRAVDPFYQMIAVLCGTVLTMILTVNFLSDLIETDKIGSLFFLCIAMLVIADYKTKPDFKQVGSNSSPDI
jgi:O-antigen ligase